MAGPSSSSSAIVPQGGKYDVFISFRGTDTRQNIISHLHAAFHGKSIEAFIDDELRRGDEVSDTLLRTIEESKVSVIVFSKNYASSRWCLDELVKILECRRRNGQIVVPVFYKVNPSDVRNQTGTFAEAFAKHERLSKQSLDSIQKWRDAMTEAANLSGWDSQVTRPEAELIKKIVGDINQKLHYISSSDFDGLIGINARIQHIESLLHTVSAEGVRILGIWGMGGIGKSTLAGAFFNQNFAQFEGHYFLANVREKSQKCGLLNLRKELLAKLLGDSNLSVNTPDLGQDFITRRLRQKKVLIVLDDVSDFQQIESLGGGHDWFGPGSIIILTSRDKQVLNSGGADKIYEVRGLDWREALSLFRRYAFKQKKNKVVGDDDHHDDRELLSRAINYCEGNPLALKVLGSFLCGRSKQHQQSALNKLERTPHVNIQRVLRVSFDGLYHEDQDMFLHIACFFKGLSIREVTRLLDGCGFSADIEIAVLKDKCLVFIQNETIQMHDLLQQMGWEIFHLEYPEEPGKRCRLWDHNDICHVLTGNRGTEAVEGIFLDLPKTRSVSLTGVAFERMYNLKLLKIEGKVHLRESLEYLPDELRYRHWDGYPLPSLPSKFDPENLVKLELRNILAEQLWSGKQADVRYPGSEVPDWFSYKITGSSITIKLPSPPAGWRNSRWFLGFALCAVAGFKDYVNQCWNFRLGYDCTFKDKNGVVLNHGHGSFEGHNDTIVDSDLVFLGYRRSLGRGEEYWEGIDAISLEFRPSEFFLRHCEVKMCGIHLVYNEGRLNFSEEEEDDEPAPKRLKSI